MGSARQPDTQVRLETTFLVRIWVEVVTLTRPPLCARWAPMPFWNFGFSKSHGQPHDLNNRTEDIAVLWPCTCRNHWRYAFLKHRSGIRRWAWCRCRKPIGTSGRRWHRGGTLCMPRFFNLIQAGSCFWLTQFQDVFVAVCDECGVGPSHLLSPTPTFSCYEMLRGQRMPMLRGHSCHPHWLHGFGFELQLWYAGCEAGRGVGICRELMDFHRLS